MSSGQRYAELVRALERGGYRLTPQREAVLRVLAYTSQHPSAEQIYDQAREHCHLTSRATVYNTMSVLKELGEVEDLDLVGLGHRYGAHSPGQHAHLICTRCSRIDDYDSPELRMVLAATVVASGYHNTYCRLDVYGECPACQGQEGHSEPVRARRDSPPGDAATRREVGGGAPPAGAGSPV
ncbi:MAG TPA: Fur family transcriptional regulator [Chloroflexota bacterium]|nr:Fur family transcriptional regulator [Chloroflexota bacterium]